MNMTKEILISALLGTAFLNGCVQLKAPKEAININLNVKIDQEVRVRLDQDVEDLITSNPDLF